MYLMYLKFEDYILKKIKNIITFSKDQLWQFRLFMLLCFIIILMILSFILYNPLLIGVLIIIGLLLKFRYNFNNYKSIQNHQKNQEENQNNQEENQKNQEENQNY